MPVCQEQDTGSKKLASHRSRRYYPLVVVCLAFALGILLDRLFRDLVDWGWQCSLMALLIWFACYHRRFYRGALCSLLLAVISLGADWHEDYWNGYRSTEIGRVLSSSYRPVVLRGVARSHASELPVEESGNLRMGQEGPRFLLKIDVCEVRNGRHWRPVTGRAICSVVGPVGHVQCGDRLQLLVQGQRIPEPQNPGEFQLAGYYRAQRTLARFRGTSDGVTVLETAADPKVGRLVEEVRRYASNEFKRHLPLRQAALASAILTGQRDQLSSVRRQAFLLTGTLHLLVVSGFHVGILASGVWLLGRSGLFRRRLLLWVVIGLAIGYAILTGGRPPVTRATTLVVVMCGARLCGRPLFAGNTIAFAAIILLVRNPACLFDPGTQLSFVAVLALMQGIGSPRDRSVADPLEQLLHRSLPWWQRAWARFWGRVYQLAWLSFLIWGATAPLVLHYFHVLSYASILLNLVLYFPMVLVMFSGLGVWGFGQVPGLASGLAEVCRVSLTFIETVVQSVQQVPASHCWGPGLPGGWLLFLYAVASVGFYWLRTRFRQYHCLAAILWLVMGGVVLPLTQGPLFYRESGLRCTFIAVGHGTSVLLEMPNGQNWLYDAGAMGRPETVGRRISELLWSRGIQRLDRLLISHADADHYNAVPYLLDRFSVQSVAMPTLMMERLATDCPDLHRAIHLQQRRIYQLRSGDSWQLAGGVKIKVLHPPAEGVSGSDNANSLVMVVEYRAEQILLPGDLEGSGLEGLLAAEPMHCSILMAPHHGSLHSDPKRVADWSQPKRVVISSGKKPGHRQVVAEYRVGAAEVWSTAVHGAVTISINATGARVIPWRFQRD